MASRTTARKSVWFSFSAPRHQTVRFTCSHCRCCSYSVSEPSTVLSLPVEVACIGRVALMLLLMFTWCTSMEFHFNNQTSATNPMSGLAKIFVYPRSMFARGHTQMYKLQPKIVHHFSLHYIISPMNVILKVNKAKISQPNEMHASPLFELTKSKNTLFLLPTVMLLTLAVHTAPNYIMYRPCVKQQRCSCFFPR